MDLQLYPSQVVAVDNFPRRLKARKQQINCMPHIKTIWRINNFDCTSTSVTHPSPTNERVKVTQLAVKRWQNVWKSHSLHRRHHHHHHRRYLVMLAIAWTHKIDRTARRRPGQEGRIWSGGSIAPHPVCVCVQQHYYQHTLSARKRIACAPAPRSQFA